MEISNSIISRQFQSCQKLAKALVKDFPPEAIHDFRVHTKKLRALLRLVAAAPHTHFSAALPANLKVFYTMTGMVRTCQLEKQAIELAATRLHLGPPAHCLAILDDRIATIQALIMVHLDGSAPLGKPKSEWHSAPLQSLIHNGQHSFITVRLECLHSMASTQLPDDGQLHMLRKAMKDLLYARPFFSAYALVTMSSKKELETLTAILGELYDTTVLLSLFRDKEFLLCTCPNAAHFLQSAKDLWEEDRRNLRNKIKGLIAGTAVNPIASIATG